MAAAAIFQQIGQTGENIGASLESSSDPNVSKLGYQTSTMFNPGQGSLDAINEGDYLGAVAASIGIAPQLFQNKDKNNLPLVDPTQQEYLETLKLKRKNLESGAAYQSQQDLVKQLGATARGNILKLSGGNIGSAVGNVIAAGRSTGKSMNELFGEMSIEGLKLDAMIGDLVNTIASRKFGIQFYEKQQADLLKYQAQQDAMRNAYAAGSKLGGSDWISNLFKNKNAGTGASTTSILNNIETKDNFDSLSGATHESGVSAVADPFVDNGVMGSQEY